MGEDRWGWVKIGGDEWRLVGRWMRTGEMDE